MTRVSLLILAAVVLAMAGCDRDERLVQQHKKAAVEQAMPGKPAAKPPALPPDDGVPPSSQQTK